MRKQILVEQQSGHEEMSDWDGKEHQRGDDRQTDFSKAYT